MKKHALFLLILLFIAPSLRAQDEVPIVVVSSAGKIRYTSPSTSGKLNVAPGAALRLSGTLTLPDASSSILLCHAGQFVRLKGKGTHKLNTLFDANSDAGIDFDADFARYVEAAVEMAAVQRQENGWKKGPANPKKNGDGWGVTNPTKSGDGWGVTNPPKSGDGWGVTNPPKSGDGWGVSNPTKSGDGWVAKSARIVPFLPFGKLQSGPTTFYWSRSAGVSSFRLTLSDDNGKVVHATTVRDTFATLRLDSLKLQTGGKYSWSASAIGKTDLATSPRIFTLAPREERDRAVQQTTDSQIIGEADALVRGMMEAVALEQSGWYDEAARKYADLQRLNAGDNMLRLMHAAFWMRYGLSAKAKTTLAGK